MHVTVFCINHCVHPFWVHCTGCPNKHGNSVTTYISSSIHAPRFFHFLWHALNRRLLHPVYANCVRYPLPSFFSILLKNVKFLFSLKPWILFKSSIMICPVLKKENRKIKYHIYSLYFTCLFRNKNLFFSRIVRQGKLFHKCTHLLYCSILVSGR